jgi:cbb3-type cytochrome oxidase cytochrome c subunit
VLHLFGCDRANAAQESLHANHVSHLLRQAGAYRLSTKRWCWTRLCAESEFARPFDFGQLRCSPNCATGARDVDRETAVYDCALLQCDTPFPVRFCRE